MESGRLYQPVQKTSEVITKFVNKKCPKGKLPREFKDVSDEEFEKVQLSEKVGKFSFDFEIEEPKEREIDVENEKSEEGLSATATGESASEKSKRIAEEIEKFNNGLTQRTREFIILCAFKQVIQNIIKEYAEVKSAVVEGSVDSSDEVVVHKLSVLFDFQIFIVKHSPSTKVIFYQTLALATDSLFLISTDIIEKFWFYLENRRSTIKQHVFDSNATSDRVAILEICNALTDKFNTRSLHLQNKTDTYKKDSFNDEFQSRVRVFLASILTLEDNTGLNKYFSTADIVSQDIITSIGTKNKDDTLLRDIIQLNKLFRDPYYYIKRENYSLLIGMSKIMLKVFNYLIDEEAKYFSAHPLRDHFSVGSESTQVTGEEKKNIGGEIVEENDENNDSKIFFSEIYSLAAFDDIKKGEKYDELKKKDTDFFARQFDENDKYRQTTLLQIYIFSSLYYELAQSNKKIFLQNIGGPLGLKHFTDNSTPESLVPIFYKIKKELTKRYRNFDNAFGHLLHNLYLTEVFWWSWLLYGKDKQLGKPLFADKVLTMVELLAVEEKSKTILPLKEKRYFNTYATPQLTRKMKVTIGLEKLERVTDLKNQTHTLQVQLDELQSKLKESPRNEDLIQQHNVTMWKLLKSQRKSKWLSFGELASKDGLAEIPVEYPVEPKSEKDEVELKDVSAGKKSEEIKEAEVDTDKMAIDVETSSRKRARDDEGEVEEVTPKKTKI